MNTRIKSICARQVLDCKARPMLEVDVYTEGGTLGRGAAPTGTSVGKYESFILRDGDKSEYNGLSVHKAAKIVENTIAPKLIGMDVLAQHDIDQKMINLDGTPDKHVLGGNSIYSVSVACLRAAAASQNKHVYQYLAEEPLSTIPLPTFNVINGGRNNDITQAFNEFILAPYHATSVEEAVAIAVAVYQKLEYVISDYMGGKKPLLGGSYGWVAPSSDPDVVLGLLSQAVAECGYTDKVCYCLDCASSEMYDPKTDTYELKGQRVSSDELIDYVEMLTEKYKLLFIEDLLDENDWDGFIKAHRKLKHTNLIGDDFIVTNLERLQKAYEMDAIDGFILKPNQVGTITESLDANLYAQNKGLLVIPSGRSGGTVGDIVADLALGLRLPISKNGAPKSGERLDKLNSLLRASSENPCNNMVGFSKFVRF